MLVTFLPEDLREPEEPSELEKSLDELLEGLPENDTEGEKPASEEAETVSEESENVTNG